MSFFIRVLGWGLLTLACLGLGADLLASLEAGHWRNLSIGDLLRQLPLAWRGVGALPAVFKSLPVVPVGLASGLGLIAVGRWLRR